MRVPQRKNVISRSQKQTKKAFKMMPLKIILRFFQIVFMTLIIMYFNNFVGQAQSEKIPIGKSFVLFKTYIAAYSPYTYFLEEICLIICCLQGLRNLVQCEMGIFIT